MSRLEVEPNHYLLWNKDRVNYGQEDGEAAPWSI